MEFVMIEAVSSGGVVIFRGKILVLYKHLNNKYEGWVLPKGTVEREKRMPRQRSGRYMKSLAYRRPL